MKLSDLPPATRANPRARVMPFKAFKLDNCNVSLWLSIRTVSEANARDHFRVVAARKKQQRASVASRFAVLKVLPMLPVKVTLTRFAPKSLDDDNLSSAFKATRDEIAHQYGIDDADARIQFAYDQKPGEMKGYAVRILIERV